LCSKAEQLFTKNKGQTSLDVRMSPSSANTRHVYCTYFDSGYLARGLTLVESLRSFGDEADVLVLALDPSVKEFFDTEQIPGVRAIDVSALEASTPELLSVKASRSRMEYYFTCTPLLVRHAMNEFASPGSVTIYVDADLFFFDFPTAVVEALGEDSVGIIEHRYPQRVAQKFAKYGRFNVGWVAFRDSEDGRRVLDWYSDRTLEWCSDTPEDGKYADQGYLDSFPEFPGVKVLPQPGFDLAPWNTARHTVTCSSTGRIDVDSSPLVFFHFHGVRKVRSWFTTSQLIYGSPLTKVLKHSVYQPYINALARHERSVVEKLRIPPSVKRRGNGIIGIVSRARKFVFDRITIVTGNALKEQH
jgi:hypothetical protein